MRILAGLLFAIALFTSASADEYVRGHYRSNGTYVKPYYRSSRDSSYNNNWSVRPNVNPYTGRMGTKSPTWNDRYPSSSNPYRSSYNSRSYSRPYSSSFNYNFGW